MAGFLFQLVTQKMYHLEGKIVLQTKKSNQSFKFAGVHRRRS